MSAILAIDIGGAKTMCVVADESGTVLSTSLRASGANLQAVGEAGLETALRGAIDEALAGRDIVPAAVCIGIAGMDRPGDEAAVRNVMKRLGFVEHVVITNDAHIALVAGVGDAAGVVVVSGTGSIAYGRNAQGHAARSGGWGHVLGDEGSGYWIGRRALAAVVRASDGRGPMTTMTPKVLSHFGVEATADLVRKVYREPLSPSGIASLASVVQEARDEGDAAAQNILLEAVDELIAAAMSVVNQLRLTREPFTFVLSGGVYRGVPWLRDRLLEELPRRAASSQAMHLLKQPALGAVRLAIAESRL